MSTETFLRAFRRFAARRSLPRHVISDNAMTFVAAAEDIERLLKEPTISHYLADRRVQWTFIPKRAPLFGGFYERLIGLTKSVLKKTLGRSLITLDELNTLVIEVEAVINDRPITYITSDIGDSDPLTPSMLSNGRNINLMPHRDVISTDIMDPDYGARNAHLQARFRRLDNLFNQCWKRWKLEYLPTLRESHIQKSEKTWTNSESRQSRRNCSRAQ